MKLIKNKYTFKIHVVNPVINQLSIYHIPLSFCGTAGYCYTGYKFYEGSGNEVTCKTCKKLMQKYIVRKLKNEVV